MPGGGPVALLNDFVRRTMQEAATKAQDLPYQKNVTNL
jgi:hypothetical protein